MRFLLLLFLAIACVSAAPGPLKTKLEKDSISKASSKAPTTKITTPTTTTTTTEIPTTVEEVTEETTVEAEETTEEPTLTETETVTEATTTPFPCPCMTPEVSFQEDPSDQSSTVPAPTGPTEVRECTCEEAEDCQDELTANLTSVETCFQECHEQLGALGNQTENYTDCFMGDKIGGFSSAEICLQNRLKEYCIKDNKTKMIPQPNYEEYLNFDYKDESKDSELYFPVQKKASKTFQSFQKFYHCAKHCVHRKLIDCVDKKPCAIQLPKRESFVESMQKCAKDHNLVHLNLWNSCRCLITEKKVDLTGQCAVLITPYYLERL